MREDAGLHSMLNRKLTLIGCKGSIYIAIFVFFFACFLGYVSNVSVDMLVKKAIIAGCLFGFIFFVAVRLLIKSISENITIVNDKEKNKDNVSHEQPLRDSQ